MSNAAESAAISFVVDLQTSELSIILPENKQKGGWWTLLYTTKDYKRQFWYLDTSATNASSIYVRLDVEVDFVRDGILGGRASVLNSYIPGKQWRSLRRQFEEEVIALDEATEQLA